MKSFNRLTVACAIAAILAGPCAFAEMPDAAGAAPAHPPKLLKMPVAHAPLAIPAPELPAAAPNAGFATKSAFTTAAVVSPDTTTLSPPITLTYSGSSPVLSVNDNGTNKGVQSIINNTSNSTSALYGLTNGSGAGLTGYNSGTVGPAGKFGILNSNSSQAAVTATTNGTGPALLATITTPDSGRPALVGQNVVSASEGTGVEGIGNAIGVLGASSLGSALYGNTVSGYGLVGNATSDGVGVSATSATGIALVAQSGTNTAAVVQAGADGDGIDVSVGTGTGVNVQSNAGAAVLAHATSGVGLNVASDSGYAIDARSTNSYAIRAHDFGNGVGVYGTSASGWAGYFDGKVWATSVSTASDRNLKTGIHAIDGKAILDKVSNLPVSAWVFKADPDRNHVGPMAQDFHAAFGLDGDDDKHINITDIAGINLAALQELSREVKEKDAQVAAQLAGKDAQIAALQQQLKSMGDAFSARMAALEQQQSRSAVTQTAGLVRPASSDLLAAGAVLVP